MKKSIIHLGLQLILGLSLLVFGFNIQATSLDRIVAVVNSEIITNHQLEKALSEARQQMDMSGMSIPDEKLLKQQVLQHMIGKRLQLQLAKRNNISATAAEVKDAIDRIAKQNQLTVSLLKDKMKQMHIPWSQYEKQIHEQVILSKVQEKAVSATISLTDQEIEDFKKHYVAPDSKIEYRISDLLIALSDNSPKEIARAEKQANELLAKLNRGADFDEAISQNAGGDMGWRPIYGFPALFTSQVSLMKKNQIIGPIRAPNGYHLLKLVDIRGEKKVLSKEALKNLLFHQKFAIAVSKWVKALEKNAYIKIQ